MDTLHSAIFYAFAAVTVGGGLAAALFGGPRRAYGVAAVGLGLAGLLADLSAGFAALVALVAYAAGATVLLGATAGRSGAEAEPAGGFARQLGATLAGLSFLALTYVAFRGDYFQGAGFRGEVNTAALGRLLLGRDALALVAVACALLVAVIVTRLAGPPSKRAQRR